MSRWVIAGCGYTGERLARVLLARGDQVVAITRRDERAAELGDRLGAQLEIAGDVSAVDLAGAVVVDSIPPSTPDGSFERALVDGCAAGGAGRLVYLSSTGVYGRGDGSWFDEDTPPAPIDARGRRRLAAETAALETARRRGLPAVALRIAGIYGPGRGIVERIRAGGYTVIPPGDSPVCRVHVDDLVTAIVAAGSVDPLPRAIYCVADDEPATSRAHADGVAAMLGLPPPGDRDLAEVSEAARAMLGAGRRISNRRLKDELGVALRYPSWREGDAAIIAQNFDRD